MRVFLPALLSSTLLAACMGPPVPAQFVATFGSPSGGYIHARGVALADQGEGFVRARPGEDTRFGLPSLVQSIEDAARLVARTFPGSRPIRVGDLSAPWGGRHTRHHSHRSGRDADIIYYATDEDGRAIDGAGFFAYDRFGVARDARDPNAPLQFLDEARNWAFIRTLLLSDEHPVQWIFCSAGVKSRLLAWARAHETNAEAIWRATYVLHQPSDGRPHDDHFHIRLGCTEAMRATGCRDAGPVWPWQRSHSEKIAPDLPEPTDDESLLDALLGEATSS